MKYKIMAKMHENELEIDERLVILLSLGAYLKLIQEEYLEKI